ncbi:MAG: hypothetical protein NTV07_04300 [Candidatus Omnitrophica bacterium]|nr:hypothetical protein [Candidatus Omnitrophota bacterium]
MRKLQGLTKEKLAELYITDKKSLEDIGKLYGVSRAAVYDKLKKFNIGHRSKSQARLEAQKQGKIPQQYFHINEGFFSQWSANMAYILGLIITDGCVSQTGNVSLSMNEKDLLEKVRQAMDSEHKITPSKHQKGLYYFNFARERIVNDLANFGILPNKSMNVEFPNIPEEFMADFIRGVFDGDGSVFFEKRSKDYPVRSSFVSSSRNFIVKLEEKLQEIGLPKRVIYEQETKNGISYMFRYGHSDSKKLFNILYKKVPDSIFLERKHRKFQEGFSISIGDTSNGK